MKIHCILCVAAITFPQFAMAEISSTGQSLGSVQATMDFCSQINPVATTKYQKQVDLMTREVPRQELDKTRQMDEYKTAYEQARTALGKASKQDAVEACNGFLEANPGPTGSVSKIEGIK